MWSMYGLYDASESVWINTPQLGIQISMPIFPAWFYTTISGGVATPVYRQKKNRAISRPFTAKRNVRKIFSSLARKLVFWCCDLWNSFWTATFTVDFVFSLFCRSQLNFKQNKIEKQKYCILVLRYFVLFLSRKWRDCGSLKIVYRYFLNFIYAHVENSMVVRFARMFS